MDEAIESGEADASVPQAIAPTVESEDSNLDAVLERLCALSDDDASKEGKSKGTSSFKFATLKKIAKKMGLVTCLAKPEMVTALRTAVKKSIELKALEKTKRDGTYVTDKNTIPRLVNLVLRYPDALQRSSALATRQDLQNKEAYDIFKTLCRAYARVKPRYKASGRHNGKDFLDFCQSSQLDLLYFHLSLECMNNPELTGYCLEGNVLHGGLDTADNSSSDVTTTTKQNKRKERQSQIQHQQDMLNFMKERNVGDLRSSKITMLKDLNVALSVLSSSWQELDKTVMNLEDDPELLRNPRKTARLEIYRIKMSENEKETASIQDELKVLRAPVPIVSIKATETLITQIALFPPRPQKFVASAYRN